LPNVPKPPPPPPKLPGLPDDAEDTSGWYGSSSNVSERNSKVNKIIMAVCILFTILCCSMFAFLWYRWRTRRGKALKPSKRTMKNIFKEFGDMMDGSFQTLPTASEEASGVREKETGEDIKNRAKSSFSGPEKRKGGPKNLLGKSMFRMPSDWGIEEESTDGRMRSPSPVVVEAQERQRKAAEEATALEDAKKAAAARQSAGPGGAPPLQRAPSLGTAGR